MAERLKGETLTTRLLTEKVSPSDTGLHLGESFIDGYSGSVAPRRLPLYRHQRQPVFPLLATPPSVQLGPLHEARHPPLRWYPQYQRSISSLTEALAF